MIIRRNAEGVLHQLNTMSSFGVNKINDTTIDMREDRGYYIGHMTHEDGDL